MDEPQFRLQCENAMTGLFRALATASDRYDFEADLNNGALTVEFEDPPAKFVVSPQAPLRQIWVSAHSRSFKLDWIPERAVFALPETGQSLADLIAEQIGKRLGEPVTL